MKYSTFLRYLEEVAITFNGKMYPKFNTVVLLAGGAGSGKGFVKDKLLGIEGWVYDVDRIKELMLASEKIQKIVKERTGQDISKFNLKNPEHVFALHMVTKELGLHNKKVTAILKSIFMSPNNRKPNIILDITMKDMDDFREWTKLFNMAGYDKRNIHIVWVANDVEVALKQNMERSRQVPKEILLKTHKGVYYTIKHILDMGRFLKAFMDGEIYIVFNKRGVDSEVATSPRGGFYIKKTNYIKVKETGKPPIKLDEIEKEFYDKIMQYTHPAREH